MTAAALLLAVLSGCQPAGVASVEDGIVAVGTRVADHLDAALATTARKPDAELLRLMARWDGTVAVDRAGAVKGLDADKLGPSVLDDPELRPLFLDTRDGQPLAAALLAKGADYLLLRRDVAPSVDMGGLVAERLYHDDYRLMFELLAVDEHFLLYRPLATPRGFAPTLAKLASLQLRARVAGRQVPLVPPLDPQDGKKWNLVASVRRDGGQELAFGMCLNDDFNLCVAELARDLEREHRRWAEYLGFPPLAEEIDSLIVEIHRVTERALVRDYRDEQALAGVWELGIDGAIILEAETRKVAIFPGAVAYGRSFKSADRFLRHAAKQASMSSVRPWRDPDARLEKWRGVHYLNRPGTHEVLPLYRGVPPVPFETLTLQDLEESLVLAGEWYLDNMAPEAFLPPNMHYEPGQVTYKFWPSENRYSSEYNLVRHTLATWNLTQAWRIEPRPEFLEGAERALDWTLQHRVDEGDMSFIRYNDNVKLGSVVVQLMGLIELAEATDDHRWDELMRRFGAFTMFMQEDNGKFDPYYVDDDHPYANETNDIVPGEAALALVMLAEYFDDDQYLAPLPKYFAYYKPWWRERVARKKEGGAWPAFQYTNDDRLELVQFGPWSVMAANAYHRRTGDEDAAAFGLEVARWMIDHYMWSVDRAPWPDFVGGYYKMPGELPAMQAFCYAEGTAAAYQLALRQGSDEVSYFEEATRASARMALQMQFDDDQLYPFPRGEVVRGGTRYALNETKVRIDYVYHAFSAVYQYLEGARTDPNLPASLLERRPAPEAVPAEG